MLIIQWAPHIAAAQVLCEDFLTVYELIRVALYLHKLVVQEFVEIPLNQLVFIFMIFLTSLLRMLIVALLFDIVTRNFSIRAALKKANGSLVGPIVLRYLVCFVAIYIPYLFQYGLTRQVDFLAQFCYRF